MVGCDGSRFVDRGDDGGIQTGRLACFGTVPMRDIDELEARVGKYRPAQADVTDAVAARPPPPPGAGTPRNDRPAHRTHRPGSRFRIDRNPPIPLPPAYRHHPRGIPVDIPDLRIATARVRARRRQASVSPEARAGRTRSFLSVPLARGGSRGSRGGDGRGRRRGSPGPADSVDNTLADRVDNLRPVESPATGPTATTTLRDFRSDRKRGRNFGGNRTVHPLRSPARRRRGNARGRVDRPTTRASEGTR